MGPKCTPEMEIDCFEIFEENDEDILQDEKLLKLEISVILCLKNRLMNQHPISFPMSRTYNSILVPYWWKATHPVPVLNLD